MDADASPVGTAIIHSKRHRRLSGHTAAALAHRVRTGAGAIRKDNAMLTTTIDRAHYRSVMGHLPTGVVAVSAIVPGTATPCGLVVGTLSIAVLGTGAGELQCRRHVDELA